MVTKAEREAEAAAQEAEAAVAAAAAGSDVEPVEGKSASIKVDGYEDGSEIVLSRGGDVVLSKTVKDGHITASDDDELAVLLGSVPGATRVEG